jgi:hypothetical protein
VSKSAQGLQGETAWVERRSAQAGGAELGRKGGGDVGDGRVLMPL